MRALLYENPITWRARHSSPRGNGMYYRNAFGVQGSYSRNPRHYRRNPAGFDLMKWFSTKKIVAGAGVAAGVVLGESLTKQLGLGYESANGAPDLAKTAIAFASTIAIGVFGGALADQVGQDDLGEAFASGAYAAAVMKLAANMKILPGVLSPGSIVIGGGGRAPARLANPVAPAAVRSHTYIPPTYSL